MQVTRKRITMITVLMVMILVVVIIVVMVKYFSGVLVEPLPLNTSVVKCFC